MMRSILGLGGSIILAPVVFLLPPHLPWGLAALIGGAWYAVRQWRGEYLVLSFSGACPRCEAPLTIEPGAKIRLPHAIDCFSCHHQPLLELDAAAESGGGS